MSPLFGPSAETILERGTPAPGTIVGIEVTLVGGGEDSSATRIDEYAVESNGTVYGVRQWLEPVREVRLGMPVTLRVDGKAAVIEWGTGGPSGWKSVKAPEPGITDNRAGDDRPNGLKNARKQGRAATVEILEFVKRSVMFGIAEVTDARCRVTPAGGEPYEATVPKIDPPFYASHLITVGAVVPGWQFKGLLSESLVLDWPAAAEANPGVGIAGTASTAATIPGLQSVMSAEDSSDSSDPSDDPSSPEIPAFAAGLMAKLGVTLPAGDGATDYDDVVSWDTFVQMERDIAWKGIGRKQLEEHALSLGIPAGEWKAAEKRWQQRMGSDMGLAMKYGPAVSHP